MSEWFIIYNLNAGYIAARKKREDEPIHSGNLEFSGNYEKDEENVKELVKKLNEGDES